MRLISTCVYGLCLGFLFAIPAKSGPVAVGLAVAEFYEKGKKWQEQQSWGRFKAYKYGQIVKFGNFTGDIINISVESHCVTESPTLNNNVEFEFACDNDGKGEDLYILIFNDRRYAVRGYNYALFEKNSSGAIVVKILSLEDMAKMTAPPPKNPRTTFGNPGGINLNPNRKSSGSPFNAN